MKKSILLVAAFCIMAISFSSCKSSAKCPAYGKAITEKSNTERA